MFLDKQKGAKPDAARTELEGIAKIHGSTGQRILAVMVGLTATIILLGAIGYKFVWPLISEKEAAVEPAAAPAPTSKPVAELHVPLEIRSADEPYISDEAPTDSPYEVLPGLAGDAKPAAAPVRQARGDRIGAAVQGDAQSLPPGMQGGGETAQATGTRSSGNDSQGQDAVAERKLSGELGDYGDQPTRSGVQLASWSPGAGSIHPECVGIRGGAEAEAECTRRMPARPAAAASNQVGAPPAPVPAAAGQGSGSQNGNALASQLNGIQTPNGSVAVIQNPSLTLRKGEPLTCTLDTALGTEQAGFVECVTDFPIYSMNGKVLLIERGTRIAGEYSRDVTPGSRSIFVLWTRGVTPAPHHVTFDLFSPGSDRLGRSGIEGDVDNKYWERYSGPLMFSVLQDVSSALASKVTGANGNTSNTGVFLMPSTRSAGESAVAELLKQGSEVKRSLYRNQGDTISITVARYVDFSPVYKLRTVKGRQG